MLDQDVPALARQYDSAAIRWTHAISLEDLPALAFPSRLFIFILSFARTLLPCGAQGCRATSAPLAAENQAAQISVPAL